MNLNDFIANDKVKDIIRITMAGCKEMGKPLPHILLSGGPGTGKNMLVNIIADEMGMGVNEVLCRSITTQDALIKELLKMNEPDNHNKILFFDEIHSFNEGMSEILYSPMQGGYVFFSIMSERIRYELRSFPIIGATTEPNRLCAPLYDRFGLHLKIGNYTTSDMINLARIHLRDYTVSDEVLMMVGHTGRLIPRVLIQNINNLIRFMHAHQTDELSVDIVRRFLTAMEMHENGLTEMDNVILKAIYDGQPIGIKNLASIIGEPEAFITSHYEPYLINQGLIKRTQKGRVITQAGIGALNAYVRGNFNQTISSHRNVSA